MTTETQPTQGHEQRMRIHELLQGEMNELCELLDAQATKYAKDRGARIFPTATPLAGSETGATEEQYAGIMEREVRKAMQLLQEAYATYYGASDVAACECGVET